MSKICAVLFDLDGTLRRPKRSGVDAFFDYVAELGRPLAEASKRSAARWNH